MAERKEGNPALDDPRIRVPRRLVPYFQEYDTRRLRIRRDADLIIGRTLEFGTWPETRWLFKHYGAPRIKEFVRESGERSLSPVTFNYWRKLFRLRTWRHSPFDISRGDVWPY